MKNIAVLILFCISLLSCQSFPEKLRNEMIKEYSPDYRSFQYVTMPMANIVGIGDIYKSAKHGNSSKPVSKKDYYELVYTMNNWFNNNLSQDEKNVIIQKLTRNPDIMLPGFNEVINRTASYGLDVMVPAIKKIVDASAHIDYKTGFNLEISIDNAYVREMEIGDLLGRNEDVLSKFNAQIGKILFEYNNYIICTKLVGLKGYKAKISITSDFDVNLKAALTSVAKNNSIIGDKSGIEFSVTSTSDNKFEFSATNDVIVALLYKYTEPTFNPLKSVKPVQACTDAKPTGLELSPETIIELK